MTNPMAVLALDIATKTGWALRTATTSTIVSGVQSFELKRGESAGMKFLRFEYWLNEMIERNRVNLIVYEMAHYRGGAATQCLAGLAGHMLKLCAVHGVEYQGVAPQTLKKWIAGSGRADKEAVMAAVDSYMMKHDWPPVQLIDDNHADALALLAWGLENVVLPERKETVF